MNLARLRIFAKHNVDDPQDFEVDCGVLQLPTKDTLMHIGDKQAANGQACLVALALRTKVEIERNASEFGFEPNLFGRVLAVASRDENENHHPWQAIVYSADSTGQDLRYIGSRDMKSWLARDNIDEKAKFELDTQERALTVAKTHLHDVERSITRLQEQRKELDAAVHKKELEVQRVRLLQRGSLPGGQTIKISKTHATDKK